MFTQREAVRGKFSHDWKQFIRAPYIRPRVIVKKTKEKERNKRKLRPVGWWPEGRAINICVLDEKPFPMRMKKKKNRENCSREKDFYS